MYSIFGSINYLLTHLRKIMYITVKTAIAAMHNIAPYAIIIHNGKAVSIS